MTQEPDLRPERRLERRRRPKGWTKATCRKGTLDLGNNIIHGILDVTETGIRLLVREQLAHDQEVAVTLESPSNARPLRVVGNVVWCLQTLDNNFCVGIRFSKRLRYIEVTKLS